ncbi:lysostaphin resistance A-like protein [Arthrobacter sp. NPDC092385]|uniref:CPBP family intramembrane glutamic endopeptidase n=1 Tax=Arthrobacter sp. NPDC092385 TaxID=3363943 RepID=UPI00381DD999
MELVDRQYAFHRLSRSWPQHRWWKPLLTALLGLAFYLVFTIALLVVGAIVALATSADIEHYMDAAASIDLSDPVIFAFTLVSLILMIPALVLAALITGPRPVGLFSSVAGHIRWRWLAVCTAAALAVFLVSLAVSTLIGFFFPEEATTAPVQQDTSTLLILLTLSLLAVPFQAAAEEYVFRGFLMQAIGSWLRHPAFAILLPVPLFVLGHTYDPLGQTDVAIFAIFAGWITWRTGGLEAAIAVHAINNMTIFVLGAFGLVDVNSSEGSVGGLIVSATTMAVTAVVIVRLADRRGIERTRAVTPQPARPPMLQPAYPLAPASPAPYAAGPDGRVPVGARVLPAHDPWGPAPVPAWPAAPPAYDASQYDSSRYHAPPASGPSRPESGQPAGSLPSSSHARPAPPAASVPPVTPAPPAPAAPATAARDHTADRHPAGPGHPSGPGYPTGPSHPAGPGYPGVRETAEDPA